MTDQYTQSDLTSDIYTVISLEREATCLQRVMKLKTLTDKKTVSVISLRGTHSCNVLTAELNMQIMYSVFTFYHIADTGL